MKIFSKFNPEAESIILEDGVGVIPTDTIYGIVGSALSRRAVSRIYRLRHRQPDKPMIILIGSKSDLRRFGVLLDARTSHVLSEVWPGTVSVILPCAPKNFSYLHRGQGTLGFRLPAEKDLRTFLKHTGPLVAPSANLEGKPPAKTIREAENYFGAKVDFYIDKGIIIAEPSTLIELQKGKIVVLRKGAVPVKR